MKGAVACLYTRQIERILSYVDLKSPISRHQNIKLSGTCL